LTLQTGHEPDRWPEVVLKELLDNSLDAAEEAGVLPEIAVDVGQDYLSVQDNGPGIPPKVIKAVLDYSSRSSSKDAYISPTRGQQGNALKTVVAIPYVLSGCEAGEIQITSRRQRHQIRITVDRIAQQPIIRHEVSPDGLVKTGTRILVRWPVSACSILEAAGPRFLQMVGTYSLFNPHATLSIRIGRRRTDYPRSSQACAKWVASEPTSPHWYTVEQLRALACAYIAAERNGARPRTVREFISEFRGLSGTAKQKTILATLPVAGVHLRDLVKNGDVDHQAITALLDAMQRESRPVKPAALGVLGEELLTAWLQQQPGGATTVTYTKTAGLDDESGRPFVVETAFGVRQDNGPLRLITGINWAPTLVDPFRALNDYGLSLDGLLGRLHLQETHPVTFVLHLACPHLNYTDRGKSSLERL
jgi:DNA topoisomerase VI subunit B